MLSRVEHGPIIPRVISGIAEPSAEIRIPHDQRKNRRGKARGGNKKGVEDGCPNERSE